MRPSLLPLAVGLAGLALLASGCASPVAAPSAAVVPVPSAATVDDLEGALSPEASASVTAAPTPTAVPAPVRPAFRYDVAAAQRSLTDLKYYAGAIDGRQGPALRSAVMAFQKVQGLGADGTVGPNTLKALAAPRTPALRGSGSGNRVEVDLSRQVLYVVNAGKLARILPVSSGNGATYSQKSGGTAKALTPTGYFTVQRRIVGERKADLGILYDPQYFYRGWAIHGSNSVPARPASHGCVRVTRTDAKYLLKAISVGTTVYLYGGAHTFTAGSKAPGTDNPTGDTAGDTAPEPTPTPTQAPASSPPAASPSASPTPTASASPSASPSRTASASPSPAKP